MEPIIPTVVSAKEAAEALGLTTHELYWNIRRGAAERLHRLADELLASASLSQSVLYFEEQVRDVVDLIAAATACDAAQLEEEL